MRLGNVTAGFLAGALLCATSVALAADTKGVSIPLTNKATTNKAPATAQKAPAKQAQSQAKSAAKPQAKAQTRTKSQAARRAARRAAIRHARRQRANFYDYAAAKPVHPGGWRQAWLAYHGMRDVRYAPPPPPPPAYDEPGLEIDRGGWTGGVGYGTSGDFVDGYGMLHYGWNGGANGPTYNSYGQSFQHNPSMARPFQPRRMGHPIPAR